MIQFDVLNRYTGAVQFTAEIECKESAPRSIKVGLAVKWAIKNKADLRGADLYGAALHGADLRGADLREADLCGASIVNLKPCMAAENTIPLDILRNARAALAAMEAADE